MPPALDPAQPPMRPVKMSMTGNAKGHSEKSAIPKPVVVSTLTTSNDA